MEEYFVCIRTGHQIVCFHLISASEVHECLSIGNKALSNIFWIALARASRGVQVIRF